MKRATLSLGQSTEYFEAEHRISRMNPICAPHLDHIQLLDYVTDRVAREPAESAAIHLESCPVCIAAAAATASAAHVARLLAVERNWPRLGLSEADAATPYLRDGQAGDLRWRVNEEEIGNLRILLVSDNVGLADRRVHLQAGTCEHGHSNWRPSTWEREVLLRQIDTGASIQVGANVIVTLQERRRLPQAAELRIELQDAPSGYDKWSELPREYAEGLYQERYRRLGSTVRRRIFGVGREDLEEIIDDFMAQGFANVLSRYDPVRPFWPYVRGALDNFCIERGRKIRRKALTVEPLATRLERGLEPSGEFVPAEVGIDSWTLLSHLPERERSLMILKYRMGLKYREIAETVHAPEGSVKAWISFAITSMRTREALYSTDRKLTLAAVASLANGARVCGGRLGADVRRRLETLAADPFFAAVHDDIRKALNNERGPRVNP